MDGWMDGDIHTKQIRVKILKGGSAHATTYTALIRFRPFQSPDI